MLAWRTIEEVKTPDGVLALRQRGERDFLLTIDGRVLMSTQFHRSEDALARLALERLAGRPRPRVLTAGLGLGITLRALLDGLGRDARVEVAELHEPIVRWCRGPLAAVNGGAANDPRVRIEVGDVMDVVREARAPFDAIVLDLMEGPSHGRAHATAHLYGPRALAAVHRALAPGGVYAVWGEDDAPAFLDALLRSGFDARRVICGGGGPRHVVYVAQPSRSARGRALAHGEPGQARRARPGPGR